MRSRPNCSDTCYVIEIMARQQAWENEVEDLNIENIELDNQLKRAEIENMQAQTEFYKQAQQDLSRIADSIEFVMRAISDKLK